MDFYGNLLWRHIYSDHLKRHGTFCAAPPGSERFKSLTPEQTKRYAQRFQYPEYFPAVRHDWTSYERGYPFRWARVQLCRQNNFPSYSESIPKTWSIGQKAALSVGGGLSGPGKPLPFVQSSRKAFVLPSGWLWIFWTTTAKASRLTTQFNVPYITSQVPEIFSGAILMSGGNLWTVILSTFETIFAVWNIARTLSSTPILWQTIPMTWATYNSHQRSFRRRRRALLGGELCRVWLSETI